MAKALIVLVCALLAYSNAQYTQALVAQNDIRTLQYALTLENLESYFYNMGQAAFTSADFVAAGYTAGDYSYFDVIKAHEAAHVSFLSGVITSLGATPVTMCNYNLGNPFASVQTYVMTASVFENLGVTAYDGAIDTLSNREFVQAAATIATIEARHAEFLNYLIAASPVFPGSFDPTKTPSQIASQIASILGSCGDITLPAELFNINQENFTAPDGSAATVATVSANDVLVLQYALFLEHLEAAFYTEYQATYSSADFVAAGFSSASWGYLDLIRQHEVAHVNALTSAIAGAGYTPLVACNYDFSGLVHDVASYVSTAASLEPVGAAAYDGAASSITNRGYVQIAATIATVEARHASILALIADQVEGTMALSPIFNSGTAFEPAKTPSQVESIVLGLDVIEGSSPSTCSPSQLPLVYNQVSNYMASSSACKRGVDGIDNADGCTGQSNPSHTPGKTGITGPTGKVGKTGKTGMTGKTGKTGMTGKTGKTGRSI